MFILGLNAYHADAAACLVCDGELVAAAEEERFRRIKHWAGLPTQAIHYCLAEAGIRIGDLDHIAINRKPGANNVRRFWFILKHRPALGLLGNRLRNRRAAKSIVEALRTAFADSTLRARPHHVEHHLAHLASAFLVSSFEEAVCVSLDGFGDFSSAAWGLGRQRSISIHGRVYFPHSLGIFYSALTQYLGFRCFGDEYKVMGLAPYGEPRFLPVMREIIQVQPDGRFKLDLRFFRHHLDNVSYNWTGGGPEVGTLYTAELEALLGPARRSNEPLEQRHNDLARSAQSMYEEALFSLLNALHREYACPNLALAGGCALNSVANGKIAHQSPFRKLFVPPAAGDAGGAIGAAFVVWNQLVAQSAPGASIAVQRWQPDVRHSCTAPQSSSGAAGNFWHAYSGPHFDDAAIESALESRGLISRLTGRPTAGFSTTRYDHSEALCGRTAKALADGLVVGWFQGRMEWGPRALGNRSILCDPRRADMKELLNLRIKRRESFRPFAPSILREHVSDWFEQADDVPFMTQVLQVRPEKRPLVPATTHVDGSGRLQTVHRDSNPLYYRLISEFCSLTNIPMVLNTSFNENEPVVCSPEEALDCFLRTKMDVLVIGNFYVCRI